MFAELEVMFLQLCVMIFGLCLTMDTSLLLVLCCGIAAIMQVSYDGNAYLRYRFLKKRTNKNGAAWLQHSS